MEVNDSVDDELLAMGCRYSGRLLGLLRVGVLLQENFDPIALWEFIDILWPPVPLLSLSLEVPLGISSSIEVDLDGESVAPERELRRSLLRPTVLFRW